MKYPHLSRAPISEAMIDIRAAPNLKNHQALAPFQHAVKDEFPYQKRQFHVRSNIVVPPDENAEPGSAISSSEIYGYICWSADRLRVIQANLKGFAFSHLHPYDQWDALRDQSQKLWYTYRQIAQPETVTRCAVRYINRLELPVSVAELARYLHIGPMLPSGMAQALKGIFMSVQMHLETSTAIVTMAIDDKPAKEDQLPVILDIDVFEDIMLSVDDKRLWDHFEKLRDVKNDIFFRCLTPSALELYQ